jgi:hypothetical protein
MPYQMLVKLLEDSMERGRKEMELLPPLRR